ncbi:YtxH domain-containing protein [Flavobacterium sp. SUN046]|uniref:YtxH domain-containing protein n=1 Tax=Flavobacterium sp. SUN046 TaxID=3002440 RepID=UPI002DB9224E|nr:YtxH domain-containing protein [Flavobacterium sp. SUN046]MEC4049911.1 YtxH domain-containing protein [Flavobacterium sp. SUN046]
MENSKNNGKMIASLVIGALAGATLGVLFAPRKGTKTRNKIAGGAEKMGKDLKRKMSKEAKDFRKNIEKEAKMLKDKAAQLEGFVEEKLESVSATLKEKTNALLHMNSDHEIKQK